MTFFTDIHSHFVYGIDDGAKDLAAMKAMLDDAWRDGIRRLIATPHATPGMKPFPQAAFDGHFAEANAYCRQMHYDIELLPGAENLYTPALPGYTEHNDLITLANSEYLLIEFIPDEDRKVIFHAVDLLCAQGYHPVIAHVERYRNLSVRDMKKLDREYPVIFQMNCSTVMGSRNLLSGRRARHLLHSGLISCVACDAHNCTSRPFCMSQAYHLLERRCGSSTADQLTQNSPEVSS